MMLRVDRSDMGAVTVLRVEGEIDESGVDTLRTVLYECMCEGRFKLVISLRDVQFISYMGAGVLVERLRKLRAAQGDLKMAAPNLYAKRLFRMLGMTSLFDTYDTEAQAIGVFQEAA